MVTQPDEYSCGAASLQSVLYYYRVSDGDLQSLYTPLGTSASNGTNPPQIVAFARGKGLTANYLSGTSVTLSDLQTSLQNRDPVMLVIEAWKSTDTPWATDVDDAHWVVIIGMDANYAYFMDPWAHFGYGYMPLSELLVRWHCEETGNTIVQHECVFFHGLAPPPGDNLVRMQ
jgi:predicted double-glycine peptidase